MRSVYRFYYKVTPNGSQSHVVVYCDGYEAAAKKAEQLLMEDYPDRLEPLLIKIGERYRHDCWANPQDADLALRGGLAGSLRGDDFLLLLADVEPALPAKIKRNERVSGFARSMMDALDKQRAIDAHALPLSVKR